MSAVDALLTRVRSGKVEIILDLSRLLSRSLHHVPTGVDRVEMAYARHLHALLPDVLAFAAVHPNGRYGRLPRKAVLRFLNETEARWAQGTPPSKARRHARAARDLIRLLPVAVPKGSARRYYIQASPNHLDRSRTVQAKLRREGARFVCLIHDLIPIEFPEYARPGGAAQHAGRLATLAAQADILLANSEATADSLSRFLMTQERRPPIFPVLLGTDRKMAQPPRQAEPPISTPYFLILGTVEPRKNHILLLNIWREMLHSHGPEKMPTLVIAGRRGWENEHVVDMLERSSGIRDHVIELSHASDEQIGPWLKGARALLMPSFAEGFGMPVAEALMAGTPVLCSGHKALREVGRDIPDYIDPLDGLGWMAAIRDYATDDSVARAAQLERLQGFELPSWDDHISGVLSAIAEIDQDGD